MDQRAPRLLPVAWSGRHRAPATPATAVEEGSARSVCVECGRIEPQPARRLERAVRRVTARAGLRATSWDLTIHGLCDRCRD